MAKLVKGVVYALTVEAQTKIKGPIGDRYFLHFTLYDSIGQVYKAEYETTDVRQQYFLPGKTAYFYVSKVEQYAEMMAPMPDGYKQKEDQREMTPSEHQRFYGDSNSAPIVVQSVPHIAPKSSVITGTPHSIAMGHAVNLYGSITGCIGIKEYNKETLFGIADDIEGWLLKKQDKMEGI